MACNVPTYVMNVLAGTVIIIYWYLSDVCTVLAADYFCVCTYLLLLATMLHNCCFNSATTSLSQLLLSESSSLLNNQTTHMDSNQLESCSFFRKHNYRYCDYFLMKYFLIFCSKNSAGEIKFYCLTLGRE